MDFKKLINVFSLFLLLKISFSCGLSERDAYACYVDAPCQPVGTITYSCGYPIKGVIFDIWKFGCEIAVASPPAYESCSCDYDAKCKGYNPIELYSLDSDDGAICVRKTGIFFGLGCGNEKYGYWDSSEKKCVICNNKIQTGFFDCSGDYFGQFRCEAACGSSIECDDKHPAYMEYAGDWCGKLGRCTIDCNCCEYTDSDGGKNYGVKGIVTGNALKNGTIFAECKSFEDYCLNDQLLVEFFIDNSSRVIDHEIYNCSTRRNGSRCVDGKCGCASDEDCKVDGKWQYDPVTHTRIVCDCPFPECSLKIEKDFTCKPLEGCYQNLDCEEGYCCDRDPSIDIKCRGIGKCVKAGTVICNNKYLCDPPNFSENKRNLLNLLELTKLNPFRLIS